MKITPALLQRATGCDPGLAELYAPHLDAACAHYQVDSAARLAAFLAQVGHESGSFRWTREIWGPTPAQLRYEGRADLGNTQPGDGSRYRGRGLIQVTGRDGYRLAAQRMQSLDAPDFEDFPEALEEPRWAAWSAADWWSAHGCNGFADVGKVVAIGRLINRGNAASTKPANGEDDRLARWERAKAALAHVDAPDTSAEPVEKPATAEHVDTEWDLNNPAPAPQPKGKSMDPFTITAVVELAKMIPRLGSLFATSEQAQKNVAAASVVVDAVVGAVGASNAQEAIKIVASDPAARDTATRAVEGVWFQITEAGGGGIAGARQASAAYLQPGAAGFWLNPSFWISMILIAMPMMLLVDVLFVHPESYVGELRTQIVTGVLMVIGMVGGYWIGTSISSARKDERAA